MGIVAELLVIVVLGSLTLMSVVTSVYVVVVIIKETRDYIQKHFSSAPPRLQRRR